MTKTEFINLVAEENDLSKAEARACIEMVFDSIEAGLAIDGKVPWSGFGTFRISHYKARDGRNPQTGEKIRIPASKKVRFSPAKRLKDKFNTKKKRSKKKR